MLPLHLALVSESSAIGITDVTRTAAALQKQVLRDFPPIWSIPATVDPFDRHLKDRAERPKEPSSPPPSGETPREFVHRRMAELELERAEDTDADSQPP